jgi:predicted RNA-binding Zn ribbon-like protein
MSTSADMPLQRIIDFVNTREVDGDLEHLRGPPQLREWLVARGLADGTARFTPADVHRAQEVREALRVVLVAHHGDVASAEVAAANNSLGSLSLHLRFGADGDVTVAASGSDIDAALGRLLAPIPAAAADGSWQRTKICPSDTCRWAFFDESRNRSRRWCSMEVCGNREKGKAFRSRHAGSD